MLLPANENSPTAVLEQKDLEINTSNLQFLYIGLQSNIGSTMYYTHVSLYGFSKFIFSKIKLNPTAVSLSVSSVTCHASPLRCLCAVCYRRYGRIVPPALAAVTFFVGTLPLLTDWFSVNAHQSAPRVDRFSNSLFRPALRCRQQAHMRRHARLQASRRHTP